MTVKARTVLSVAVQATKLGYVFLIDGVPYDWELTMQANRSTKAAFDFTIEKLRYYQPELVVTERVSANPHKGERAEALVNAIWKAAQDSDIEWMCVDRVQKSPNKYAEAALLAKRFPELLPYLPRTRTLWDEEPRRMIIFEAVALGLSVVNGSENANG